MDIFSNNGQYPKYNRLQLFLNRNQNNQFVFDWEDIHRDYKVIPYIGNYNFIFSLYLHAEYESPNSEIISINNSNHIVIDEKENLIICNVPNEFNIELKLYHGGTFKLDYADNTNNYTTLVSGTWSVEN